MAVAVKKVWLGGGEKKNFKEKKNPDLWKRFIPAYQRQHIKFKWVKGHAGNIENERCDQLAVMGSQGSNLQIDQGFEAL